MSDSVQHICGNCLYRVKHKCYYNPPAVIWIDYKAMSIHPPVKEDDRCARWQIHPRLK